ncbi:Protein of uncharacterised function (DUF2988) [Vibrio mimicus]|nr:Protein of uncharacterised function (DUF2988) [Vibrio mimicus]
MVFSDFETAELSLFLPDQHQAKLKNQIVQFER